jgi:N-methylhydantoinase A
MIAFGGCAPLHAARVAEKLGIERVIVPRSAGVGSAVGFLRAPIAYEVARSLPQRLDAVDFAAVNAALADMGAEARDVVEKGAAGRAVAEERFCFARYRGQGYEIPVEVPARALVPGDEAVLLAAFEAVYRAQYGGVTLALPVEILTWRVAVHTHAEVAKAVAAPHAERVVTPLLTRAVCDPGEGGSSVFGLFDREALAPGDRIEGPALIAERETTTVVSPAFDALIDAAGFIILERKQPRGGRP